MMLMKKNGHKKCATCVILTVGALAAVGAMTVTGKGRELMCCFKNKLKGMMSRVEGTEE